MLSKSGLRVILTLLTGLNLTVRASDADITGVTTFRAATTNLFGTGIRIGQAEADDSSDGIPGQELFEVNPANVGAPAGNFTYISAAGSSSAYPNSVGVNSGHAESVADFFYGTVNPGTTPAGIATNVAHVDVIDANYFVTNRLYGGVQYNLGDVIINQSFAYGSMSGSQQQAFDSYYDNYAMQFNVLFVSSVGVSGSPTAPATSYDGIAVGAYNSGGLGNSATGPTIDNGRCKPDLVAPDLNTSFAAPQVAGSAAVLLQAGGRGDGGTNTTAATNLCTIKALLLNGCVKPLGWTNGPLSPLDARYGAGMLNLYNAYEELVGGRHTNIATSVVTKGTAHPPTSATGTETVLNGWDYNTNSSTASQDAINHYYFNVTNAAGSPTFQVAATLVWNRHYNGSYAALGNVQAINNLALFLYKTTNNALVDCSTSLVDNVQHLYVPKLTAGRYDLQVWKAGGSSIVSAAESYALAFAFNPPPTLTAGHSGTNFTLAWPAYPDGFQAQVTNGLATNMGWSTANLPATAITNQQDWLVLNHTNRLQFFRLMSPEF